MICQLVIELDNSVFTDDKRRKDEFARILREAARRVGTKGTVDDDLYDVHLHRVGGYQFIP